MPHTQFPITLAEDLASMEDSQVPMRLYQSNKAHKHDIKAQISAHSLSGDLCQKRQTITLKSENENDFNHPFDHYSPNTIRILTERPFHQTGSPFPDSRQGSQTRADLFSSQATENHLYKSVSQGSELEAITFAHGLDNFVNMFSSGDCSYHQQQQQSPQHHGHHEELQNQQPTTPFPLSSVPNSMNPWEAQAVGWEVPPNAARMFMNSTILPVDLPEKHSFDDIIDEFNAGEPFGGPNEAWSFTWNIKDDKNVVETTKPKRRKLTPLERARTKALKLAGGACDNCRRKKKKCTHKTLADVDASEDRPLVGGDLTQLHSLPPSSVDRDIQSRLYAYSSPTNAGMPYTAPDVDCSMRTPSDTNSYVVEHFTAQGTETYSLGPPDIGH